MNIEELKIIAETLSNMGDMGLSGVLWYLGLGIVDSLIGAVVILVAIWVVYKVLTKVVNSTRNTERLRAIGSAVDEPFVGDCATFDYDHIHRGIRVLSEYKGKYDEQRLSLKDYMGRLGSLTKDYEDLWDIHEKLKKRETALIKEVRHLDPAINDEFDKEEVGDEKGDK